MVVWVNISEEIENLLHSSKLALSEDIKIELQRIAEIVVGKTMESYKEIVAKIDQETKQNTRDIQDIQENNNVLKQEIQILKKETQELRRDNQQLKGMMLQSIFSH